MTTYSVFYRKESDFYTLPADLLEGASGQTVNDPRFVFVRDVEAEDLEDVFWKCQGEVWSPNGEARDYIRALGLKHTSMSVCDLVTTRCFDHGWLVDRVGFKQIW